MGTTRLDIRMTPNTKALIRQAAELRQQSVTEFAVAALQQEAGRVVAESGRAPLSDRDRDRFLCLLDAPPAPNAALRRAVARQGKRAAT